MERDGDAGVVTFATTTRQLRGQQLWGFPLLIALIAALTALLAIIGALSREVVIYLGVLLVVCVAGLLAAPWWVARTAATHFGIKLNHRQTASLVPWASIAEIQTVRRHGTVRVVLKLRSGRERRLHAPYSGRWLAHDPAFDTKVDTLRSMWRQHGEAG